MSTPAQGDQAVARAREALGIALGVAAPAGVRLRDGSFRLDAQEVLPADVVSSLDAKLSRRAADQASDERLLAEAVAHVGAQIALNRDLDPADGATAALDRLLHATSSNSLTFSDGPLAESDPSFAYRPNHRSECSSHRATKGMGWFG